MSEESSELAKLTPWAILLASKYIDDIMCAIAGMDTGLPSSLLTNLVSMIAKGDRAGLKVDLLKS